MSCCVIHEAPRRVFPPVLPQPNMIIIRLPVITSTQRARIDSAARICDVPSHTVNGRLASKQLALPEGSSAAEVRRARKCFQSLCRVPRAPVSPAHVNIDQSVDFLSRVIFLGYELVTPIAAVTHLSSRCRRERCAERSLRKNWRIYRPRKYYFRQPAVLSGRRTAAAGDKQLCRRLRFS